GDGLVLRVYEPHGNRGTASLTFQDAPTSASRVNILEEPVDGGDIALDNETVSFEIGPFEVVTLRLNT
ncbi:MAG: glycosyl hydrolase-related protein, partial [Chloroflexota bacterium]|nr:glycosyl hydrolase-related protein [Chloroflexota bacterium]